MGKGSLRSYFLKGPVKIGFLNELDLLDKSCFKLLFQMVTMKLRHPYTTASMWSSGKITCTGANSEAQARTAARKYARFLQKLGFNTRFTNYRVVNVLGTCTMPFAIKITQFSQEHREARYFRPDSQIQSAKKVAS